MSYHVLSVKFSDEEWEALEAYAEQERLYKHGVIKIAIREKLELPIPTRLQRSRVVTTG